MTINCGLIILNIGKILLKKSRLYQSCSTEEDEDEKKKK